jgi:hypothetical protein
MRVTIPDHHLQFESGPSNGAIFLSASLVSTSRLRVGEGLEDPLLHVVASCPRMSFLVPQETKLKTASECEMYPSAAGISSTSPKGFSSLNSKLKAFQVVQLPTTYPLRIIPKIIRRGPSRL